MNKRYIAPIVITAISILVLAFVVVGFFFDLFAGMPLFLFILSIISPVACASVMIYMLVQRIEEIHGGEEDEASKY